MYFDRSHHPYLAMTSGPPPPGVSMLSQSSQRQRVPPPPGEDSREVWQSDDMGIGPKIPQALEKLLQLKEFRQEQLIAAPTGEDDVDTDDTGMNSSRPYSDDEEELSRKRISKRRNRKKKRNQEKSEQVEWRKSETEKDKEKEPEVEIEYVTEEPETYDPNYILKKLQKEAEKDEQADCRRAQTDVVEMHDVTAHEPKLLVHLKATRNTVPVPRHWCFKRKYLQGKRGIEKPPFELPEFIKRTGIQEMREALQEKGKEIETRLKEKKPEDLSDELSIALGMPTGPAVYFGVIFFSRA
ncbi:splicing factor 3B subunit 2 [Silurus meridionalis]|nr:splicing factor 3B subunit 2 [Silurus meridionalis]